MNLELCEVLLRKIDEQDLEMLRQWRNDEKIAIHMFYQEYISREMQFEWFQKLSENDYYFVIEYKKLALGLIHLTQVNRSEGTGEAGLYIYNDKYWGGPLPVLASISLLKFAFESLGLLVVKAKVKRENFAARKYNKSLGFKDVGDEWQILTKDDYQKRVIDLMYLVKILCKKKSHSV